jgi:hypothetical protein
VTITRDALEDVAPSELRPAQRRVGSASWLGLDALYTLVFAVIGWVIGSGRLVDNSFFWHLRTGEIILDHGIPRSDPFSFTAHGIGWIAQSWLIEVVYGGLYRIAGGVGIRFFGAVLGATIAVLILRLAVRLCHDRMRGAALGLAVLLAAFSLWSQRPLLVGLLLFLGLVWLVEVPDSRWARHTSVVLPLLLWLWVNVHGTFMLGFAYLGLHLVGRWLDGAVPWEGRERTLLVATAIGFVLAFANPYGPALVLFPIHLLGRGDVLSHVIEWKSPSFRELDGQALGLWIVLFVVTAARGTRRMSRRDLVIALPFLLLAFWAQRNIALAAIATLPLVARGWARPAGAADTGDGERRSMLTGVLVVSALLAIALVSADVATTKPFDFAGYPVKAMQVVQRDGLLGSRLASDDGWGGYIILRYWPQQRVFVDDRYDMYPTTFMRRYLDLDERAKDWDTTLRRYDVEVVVWPTKGPLTPVLAESPDWVRVHADPTATVFVRRDVAAAHRLG